MANKGGPPQRLNGHSKNSRVISDHERLSTKLNRVKSQSPVMAEKDGPSRRVNNNIPDPLPFSNAINDNKPLLTKLKSVEFQIFILDKRHKSDVTKPGFILYPNILPSTTENQKAAETERQSMLSFIVKKLPDGSTGVAVDRLENTGVFGVYSYPRIALVVVHLDADKNLVAEHTNYLKDRFEDQKGLEKWFKKRNRLEIFRKDLETFLKVHLDSIK